MSTSDSTPKPHHVAVSPCRSSSGTTVPEAAIPSPTPAKIAPLASPRRRSATWGSTAGAASTISTPPLMPDSSRQAKNHGNGAGTEQAKNATAASSIAPRSSGATATRPASGRPSKAPARYPTRFAAPKYAAAPA